MSDKNLIARTGEWETTLTGKFQATGFDAVDKAVATQLSTIFSNLLIVDPQPEEKRLAAFLKRPAADRVYTGRFDSVIECLKAIRRANKGQGRAVPAQPLNRDALPIINVSRSMDISYDNSDHQIDRRHAAWFKEPETGMPLAQLEYTQATLTYDVTLLAAEKATLSLMCNAMGCYLRFLLGTQFEASTSLVRVPVALICGFVDAKETGFSDVSAPLGEERIFAAAAPLVVNAEVISAREVNARRIVTVNRLEPNL